jgi:hypothetical protein
MSKKISGWEPAAERPYTVALSAAEVHALVNHHVAMTKRCTKFVGNKLLKLQAGSSVLPKKREVDAYIEEGRKIVEAHIKRAQGLQSFLKT